MLSRFNNIASERFYEFGDFENSLCLECKEAVYNPLCPSCLALQVEAWLASYPYKETREKILFKIKDYVKKTNHLPGKPTTCVSCKKAQASLCPYCFTEYVFNLLKKLKVNRIMLKEFLMFFNYDFEHTGYSKEAEKLGVI